MAASIEVKAFRKQGEFISSTADTVVFQGGAGSGKTRAGALKSILRCLGDPGSRGMIVGATFPSLRQAIVPALDDVFAQFGDAAKHERNKSENSLVFPNGTTVWLRSADNPGSLLGADLSWVWGDEVGLWKRDAYAYLTGRLRQPGHSHQAWYTFTPKGRNWAYETLGQPREGLQIIKVGSGENCFVGPDFLQRLRREYGEGSAIWRQEVLGEYVAFEGLVYPTFDCGLHVEEPLEGTRWATVVAGLDWGWENPGVILIIGMDTEGCVWALEEDVASHRSIDDWAARARVLFAKWGVRQGFGDPSQPANIDRMRALGVPVTAAQNAVLPGITTVNGFLLDDKLRVTPDCKATIAELTTYSWKRRPDGTTRADEPEKLGDHCMDALRYGGMGLTRPMTSALGLGYYAAHAGK